MKVYSKIDYTSSLSRIPDLVSSSDQMLIRKLEKLGCSVRLQRNGDRYSLVIHESGRKAIRKTGTGRYPVAAAFETWSCRRAPLGLPARNGADE